MSRKIMYRNKKCFKCDAKAKFILKNFWLGMSFMPVVCACEDCKNRITKAVRNITVEEI